MSFEMENTEHMFVVYGILFITNLLFVVCCLITCNNKACHKLDVCWPFFLQNFKVLIQQFLERCFHTI
jgi:hypothetical protein